MSSSQLVRDRIDGTPAGDPAALRRGASAQPAAARRAGRRVLYVVSLFPCWSETFIVREIQALLNLGVDVRVLSLKHPSEALVQADARTLLGRVLYPPRGPALLGTAAVQLLRHPLTALRELGRMSWCLRTQPLAWAKSCVVWLRTLAVLPAIERLAPDRLHAHWATYPSTAAMWVSGRTRIPFSFTAHAHDIFTEDQLLADKLREADFAVTISEFNRQYLAEHVSPRARDVVRVVHCGVPVARYAFRPDGRRPARVLGVGRLDPIKGFGHLIDACAILRDRGVEFDCRIVGDGPLRGALQARIDALALQPRVRLVGACAQEQVLGHLHAASVFVMPSVVTPDGNRDGIPVALMEAMACGTPVVATRVSGIPELVEHGVSGLLAAPGDARDLADAIERQLRETTRAQAMARRARRKVEAEFDADREAEKLHAAMA